MSARFLTAMLMSGLMLATAGSAVAAATDMTAPIAGRHMAKGAVCQLCHPTQKNAIDYRNCLGCHGGADGLAKKSPIHNMVKYGQADSTRCAYWQSCTFLNGKLWHFLLSSHTLLPLHFDRVIF